MMESVFERERCGLCGRRLTTGNCLWATWPGLCIDCIPDSAFVRRGGYRSSDAETLHRWDFGQGNLMPNWALSREEIGKGP